MYMIIDIKIYLYEIFSDIHGIARLFFIFYILFIFFM